MVDPVFSANAAPVSFLTKRFQDPVLKSSELPPIDAIVISHDHYDHLDKATVEFFHDKGTKFIVPLKVGTHLESWGIPKDRIVELNWDESYSLGHLKFTATTAHHVSGRSLFDQKKTLWASWIFQGQTQSIYYSGDTGYTPHFQKIGERYGPFDYAFIENGQYNVLWPDHHMQPEQSIQAAFDLKAKAFIPVHWGMFDLALHHWSEPVVRSSKIAEDRGMTYISPILGQMVDTNALPEFQNWWEDVLKVEEGLASVPSSQAER